MKQKPSLLYSTEQELSALAENIRIARKRRKLSIQDLASRANTSPSTLSRIEAADPTVAIGTIMNVLEILNLARGISEITNPEHDVAQVLNDVRAIRLKLPRKRKRIIKEEDLQF